MRRATLPALLAVLASPSAAELFVTRAVAHAVAPGEAPIVERADLEFNTHLLVRGVELVRTGEHKAFRLPVSGSLEREFVDIRVLSKPLFDKILETFETRTYLKHVFKADEVLFTIAAPRMRGSPKRFADVDVTFGGELVVTFGVMKSGTGFDALYPSWRRSDGKRERIFDILDANLRRRVEAAIAARVAAPK